jgi:hypothetical protein
MENNKSILGHLFPTQLDLMNHLAEYGMLTDDQIIERASQGGGLDAEEALTLTCERDFCKGAIDNIVGELSKLANNPKEMENQNEIKSESNSNNENVLKHDCYWVGDEWIQPPTRIKHGDLVNIEHEEYLPTMLGRYIGKGYGVVELYNYATGTKHVVGKVVSRGLDMNPRLISDKKLFEFIKD